MSIKFTNIAYIDAVGDAGDDEFIVLSTNPSVLVSLYGGEWVNLEACFTQFGFMIMLLITHHTLILLTRSWVGHFHNFPEGG